MLQGLLFTLYTDTQTTSNDTMLSVITSVQVVHETPLNRAQMVDRIEIEIDHLLRDIGCDMLQNTDTKLAMM